MSDGESRQPKNLQGLFRFCTSATGSATEDAPNTPSTAAMDPERMEFLRQAMAATRSAVQVMGDMLDILLNSKALHDKSITDTDFEEQALENLNELVQDIDNANDLVKIGGVHQVVAMLSQFKQNSILSLICEVLGSVSQNNPNSQDALIKLEVLKTLMTLTSNEEKKWSLAVGVKALLAVSCLIRGHKAALDTFHDLNGFSWLMSVMRMGDERILVKATFLVQALLLEYQPAKEHLMSLGYAELLIRLLCYGNFSGRTSCNVCMNKLDQELEQQDEHNEDSEEYNPCREHCTDALFKLCSVSEEARDIATNYAALTKYLTARKIALVDKEAYQDEVAHIVSLEKLLSRTVTRACVGRPMPTCLVACGPPAC